MGTETCSRPACPGQPVAWLAYDYGARCAWLDDLVLEPAEGPANRSADRSTRWPLCERHADTLQVPKGWSCVDRRGSVEEPMGAESLECAEL